MQLKCNYCSKLTYNVDEDREKCPECGSTNTYLQTSELDDEEDTLQV